MSLPFRLPRPALSASDSREARLHPYVVLVTRYWAVVLASIIVGALAGYGLSQLVTPSYAARSTLYFSIDFGESGSDLNQGASYTQSQMLSFAELASSERVLQPVITQLGLETTVSELASRVSATTPANTVVLDLSATSSNPQTAASIADAVAQSLTDTVREVAPRDGDGRATVSVRTVQTADVPTSPVAPNTRVNVVAGALIGLLLSLLAIIALRLLDTRVHGRDGVAAAGGLPVLARLGADSAVTPVTDPQSAAAEDYRRLVAMLDAIPVPADPALATRARVVVLASVVSAHGPVAFSTAETVGASLAQAASEAGHRVVLASDSETTPAGGQSTLTSRPIPDTGVLPVSVTRANDLVLIAAPGGADSSRTLRLGQGADGVVVIAAQGTVHVGELRAAIDLLNAAGARVLGTVLITASRSHRIVATDRPRRIGMRRSLPAVLEHHEA